MSEFKLPSKAGRGARPAEAGRIVVHSAEGWAVKSSAGGRASSVHDTMAEAIEVAQDAIGAKGGTLVVRDGKGRARSRYAIGRDPFRKISAIEGIAPTDAAEARAKQFTRSKLSSEERLKAIIEAHRPAKG